MLVLANMSVEMKQPCRLEWALRSPTWRERQRDARRSSLLLAMAMVTALPAGVAAQPDLLTQLSGPANAWVKRTPASATPVSPRLGYEGACVWDNKHEVVIRYGGHNQGGGGEQGSEVWTCRPLDWKWTLKEPNTSPPGVCCNAQNVFDPVGARYLRFPSFSGSHGWQWWREIYLNAGLP